MTSEFRILTQQEVEECNWGESEELNELFLKHQEKIFQQFGVKRLLTQSPTSDFSHYGCNSKTYQQLLDCEYLWVKVTGDTLYFRGEIVRIDERVEDDYIMAFFHKQGSKIQKPTTIYLNSILK